MQNGQSVGYASRALTPTESQYAQIEKELLAIVFACDHFEAYIYGRDEIHVKTDHKPLESIMRKPLNNAPTRLQRMLLKLQKHNLSVTYRKGTTIVLADTLSRAYLSDDDICEFLTNLETVDHTSSLMVRKDRLQQIKHATKDDPVLLQLKQMIQSGWPNDKKKVPPSIRAYYDFRDELIVQDHLVFKGSKLVGGSLSEPHTSEKLGTVVTYTNNYEKKRRISIFGWYGRFTYTNNSNEKRTNSIFGWYDCSCRKR